MKILIIEDEPSIAAPIQRILERRAYAVDYVEDGRSGYEMAKINEYDCILLDLNLPEMDGLEVAKMLRKDKISTPILMLTARTTQQDKWEGFESGTDDYLTKPFDIKELLLRIKALVRRNSKNEGTTLSVEDLTLDLDSLLVTKGSEEITLNNKEFGILEYLLRNKGKVVSTEELLEHVWNSDVDSFTQAIRTHIKTLRQKIDPNKKIILTKRGVGYVIR